LRKKLEGVIKIGTRGSKLALWQARYLQESLEEIGLNASINIIKTRGEEIEEALLHKEIDLAVHSMKDLPTTSPPGLVITAVSYREDPADWLIVRKDQQQADKLLGLAAGAVVGTSSARRKAQLLHFRADLELRDIRGNVPTRLDKLRQGDFAIWTNFRSSNLIPGNLCPRQRRACWLFRCVKKIKNCGANCCSYIIKV
jgi:hydroxymethylbilane synthase